MSGTRLISISCEGNNQFEWKKIWKLDLPPRVKHFLWLTCHGRLFTKEACFKRHLSSTASCPRCGAATETILHLLRDCPSSRAIWIRWMHGSRLDHFDSLSLSNWFNLSRSNFMVSNYIPWSMCFFIRVLASLDLAQ